VYLFGWNEVRHGEAGESDDELDKGRVGDKGKACGQRCVPVVAF
jgi:hypothetical protein